MKQLALELGDGPRAARPERRRRPRVTVGLIRARSYVERSRYGVQPRHLPLERIRAWARDAVTERQQPLVRGERELGAQHRRDGLLELAKAIALHDREACGKDRTEAIFR